MKKDKKEVEYKEKAGTAWSHSYLNQKPWHPLSYPNQRRKWIAEQTHAQKEERRAEVAREFAQEQEFFRQTAQMSRKEKEKMEALQAVSFMYIRPPGYNAEAARAAELADEKKKLGLATAGASSTADTNAVAATHDGDSNVGAQENKKRRAKDVFGMTLPTEEEFPALKNAPRHDTGAPTRVKPFAIEIRNVKCARCGAFGHQSGDRECPLKDVLMPNEEARLIREDPLNVILAQTASDEPVTWELKQKPGGLSPARGGFKPDDPNQQIIPDEDIYDEYGGFLPGGGEEGTLSIPSLLASLSHGQRKELTDVNAEKKGKRKKLKKERRKHTHSNKRKSDSSNDDDQGRYRHRDEQKADSSNDDEQRRYRHRDEQKSDSSNNEHGNRRGKRNTGISDNDNDWKTNRCDDNGKLDGSCGERRSHRSRRDRESTFHKDDQRSYGFMGRRKSDRYGNKNRNQRPDGTRKACSSDDDQRENRPTSKGRFGSSADDQQRLKPKDGRRDSSEDERRRHRRESEFMTHDHRMKRRRGKYDEKLRKRCRRRIDKEHSSSSESNSSHLSLSP